MRKLFAIFCLLLIFSLIGILFWYNEWRYSLPTPVPEKYYAVKLSSYITIADTFKLKKDRPVFLHFFNPDCPCSRFNIPHFKSLVTEYADKISLSVVVMRKRKKLYC